MGPSSFDLTKICQITKRRNFLKTGQGLWICQVFGTAEVNELAITFISINGKWKNRTSKTPNRQSFCIAFSQEKLTVLHTSRPNQHVLGPQARKCKSRTSFRLSALFIPNYNLQVLQDPVSYFTIKCEFGHVSTPKKHGKEMCKAETSEMLASNLGERSVHREDIGSGCCKVDRSHYIKYSVYRCV